MSQSFNPSNVPGTCLWCGRKLRPYMLREMPWAKEKGMRLGSYGDNHFCGLTCGYDFGKALAGFGRRLIRKDEPKKEQPHE